MLNVTLTADQLRAIGWTEDQIAQAEAQQETAAAAAEAKALKSITFGVSPKGAVSVYGLQKWPVTLYGAQWEKLNKRFDALLDFIDLNRAKLATK